MPWKKIVVSKLPRLGLIIISCHLHCKPPFNTRYNNTHSLFVIEAIVNWNIKCILYQSVDVEIVVSHMNRLGRIWHISMNNFFDVEEREE